MQRSSSNEELSPAERSAAEQEFSTPTSRREAHGHNSPHSGTPSVATLPSLFVQRIPIASISPPRKATSSGQHRRFATLQVASQPHMGEPLDVPSTHAGMERLACSMSIVRTGVLHEVRQSMEAPGPARSDQQRPSLRTKLDTCSTGALTASLDRQRSSTAQSSSPRSGWEAYNDSWEADHAARSLVIRLARGAGHSLARPNFGVANRPRENTVRLTELSASMATVLSSPTRYRTLRPIKKDQRPHVSSDTCLSMPHQLQSVARQRLRPSMSGSMFVTSSAALASHFVDMQVTKGKYHKGGLEQGRLSHGRNIWRSMDTPDPIHLLELSQAVVRSRPPCVVRSLSPVAALRASTRA